MNPYLEIDDETLVRECEEGNPDALGLFYTRFAPKMHSVVRRYVTDNDDAKDILHDGFVVAFTRLKSLRNIATLEYWLATIMKNLSLQFLQAQSMDKVLHEIPEVEDTPEFDDIIDLQILESLIQKLPKGYQTVFRLSVLENKTHKEIAKILGIAPNSSSSQLFHAKLMMRKLVMEYRQKAELMSLLLIAAVTIGVLWRANIYNNEEPAVADPIETIASSEEISIEMAENRATEEQSHQVPDQKLSTTAAHIADTRNIMAESDQHTILAETDIQEKETEGNVIQISSISVCDSVAKESLAGTLQKDPYKNDILALNAEDAPKITAAGKGWSFKISVNPGISPSDLSDLSSSGDLASNPSDSSPEDPPGHINEGQKKAMSKAEKDYKDTAHSNDLPVTVSFAVGRSISKAISLETGLTYTYLHTSLERNNHSSDCHWHYLGIPLKITLNNYSDKTLRLYAAAGVQLDLPLQSFASSGYPDHSTSLPEGKFHSSAVWSVSASYGVNFNITRHTGIFIEPTLQYHFYHEYKVPNAWTDNKIEFSIPIGLRFNF